MILADALQAALALEHQAVYGYGLVVAELHGQERRLANDLLQQHQQRRDDLSAMVAALRREPTPAAPAYVPPHRVTDRLSAITLAASIEDAAAGAAWDVVAAASAASGGRRFGVDWISAAAVASTHWHALAGSVTPALPGQPPSQPSRSGTSSSRPSTTPSGSTS